MYLIIYHFNHNLNNRNDTPYINTSLFSTLVVRERIEVEMKVAPIVVFLFRDTEGFASTISQAFRPKPSSSFTRQ